MYSERDAETRAGQDWKWQTQETGGATERVYTQKSRGGEEETKGKGDTRTCWMRAVKATMWPSVPAPCHLARVLRGALRAKS